MFNQVVGDGANLFILIVGLLIGFLNALAYVDMKKVEKEQNESGKDHYRVVPLPAVRIVYPQ